MRLTWQHDGLATALVAAAAGLYGAYELGSPVAGFGGVRMVSAGVLVLAIAACAAGGGAPDTSPRWQTFVAWLGTVGFGLTFVGMAWGSVLALRLAVGEIAGIWAITPARRVLARPATTVEAPAERREPVGGRR